MGGQAEGQAAETAVGTGAQTELTDTSTIADIETWE